MSILEVRTIRTHLRRCGIEPDGEGLRRVSQEFDPINGATRYVLDRGKRAQSLLFTSRIVVQSVERKGQRKMMYCAELWQPEPKPVPGPANPASPRAGILDERLAAEIGILKDELGDLGISLQVALVNDGELWVTIRLQGGIRLPGGLDSLSYQIRERLASTDREVKVHYLPAKERRWPEVRPSPFPSPCAAAVRSARPR